MNLIRYGQWSRRSRGASPSSHPVGRIQGVTFHWEGPHMGDFPHSACADKVQGIQAFHRDGRKWADLAYNALVCPHGYVFEGRGPNVASAANGYATANATWYAVCYLGGERDPFTDAAKQGFRDAVAWLRAEGNAGPGINGHRDHKATACPGDVIYRWLKSGDAEPTNGDDDMPYTDWPEKDRNALVRDVVNGLQRRDLYGDERDDTPADAFRTVLRLEKKLDQIIAALGSVDAAPK